MALAARQPFRAQRQGARESPHSTAGDLVEGFAQFADLRGLGTPPAALTRADMLDLEALQTRREQAREEFPNLLSDEQLAILDELAGEDE